jgi:hypothetical protein
MTTHSQILSFSKRILPREIYKKIKSIRDKKEQIEISKTAIRQELQHIILKVERDLREVKTHTRDTSVVESKATLLPSKIKHFLVDFNKDDFYKLSRLLNDIKKEIKNARAL